MRLGTTWMFVFATPALMLAQVPNPTQNPQGFGNAPARAVPIYRINVVSQSTVAINYGRRGGETKIGFRGTVLLPAAKGKAVVKAQRGVTRVEAKFQKIEPPTKFGRQYLTYVLWALTPDGRASNLGEIIADDDNDAKLSTSTVLQTFALIVTVEPYHAVTQPSDVVVLENVLEPGQPAVTEMVNAKYELLKRGEYDYHVDNSTAAPPARKVSLNEYEALLQLYQARNAVNLARAEDAARLAPGVFADAERFLRKAEELHARKDRSKEVIGAARNATQAAEDARIVALRRKQQALESAQAR